MADSSVSLEQLGAWLARFETLLQAREADPADRGANLARGMTAVTERVATGTFDSVGELFTAVGMTLVGSASGASGPLYGTFFLRFGMNAGEARDLDAGSLGRALRAGQEGAVERGTAALGDTTVLETLSRGVEAYDAAIAGGADVADAASTALTASLAETGRLDRDAASVALLFEALATSLESR